MINDKFYTEICFVILNKLYYIVKQLSEIQKVAYANNCSEDIWSKDEQNLMKHFKSCFLINLGFSIVLKVSVFWTVFVFLNL